ncbi:uncharacterized protein [Rutidosis leptorrhynchoides]|uniref:uncharacterized protein n=1 Tax=Rutidosis leptorrhynchoides TaxID=125765 RepID=UPI003A98D852
MCGAQEALSTITERRSMAFAENSKDSALHKCMTSRGINTVQDFLELYKADVLGSGITKRTWESIVRHASPCVINDDDVFLPSFEQGQYSVQFGHESCSSSTRWPNLPVSRYIGPLSEDRPEVTPEFSYSLVSASCCCNVTEIRQLGCLGPHLAREDFLSSLSAGESSHLPGYTQDLFAPNIHLSPEVPSPISGNLMWTPGHTFIIESSSGADFGICPSRTGYGVHNSRIARPKVTWCKIRDVVKWGLVRRVVPAKRRAMFNCASYPAV